MAAKKTEKVGTTIKVPKGAEVVVRPDGTQVTVSGGLYVLDTKGTHLVGDREVVAR